MNPAGWLQRIDRVTQQVTDRCAGLDGTRLNWKPNPTAWSLAQVVDHLMVVNRSEFPTLDALLRGTHRPPLAAKVPGWARLVGALVLRSQQPSNRRPTKTMSIWQPAASTIPDDIVARFASHQDELKGRVEALAVHLPGAVVIASPASSLVVYRLETALELLVAHEERHVRQLDITCRLMQDGRELSRQS